LADATLKPKYLIRREKDPEKRSLDLSLRRNELFENLEEILAVGALLCACRVALRALAADKILTLNEPVKFLRHGRPGHATKMP